MVSGLPGPAGLIAIQPVEEGGTGGTGHVEVLLMVEKTVMGRGRSGRTVAKIPAQVSFLSSLICETKNGKSKKYLCSINCCNYKGDQNSYNPDDLSRFSLTGYVNYKGICNEPSRTLK